MGHHLVFVYGTLKRGYPNNGRLDEGRFIGPAVTRAGFAMWDYGSFPMVARPRKAGYLVSGEVFLVDDEGLAGCDRLEGHPRFYQRHRIRVNIEIGSGLYRERYAWVYLRKMRDASGFDLLQPGNDGFLRWTRERYEARKEERVS